MTDPVPVAFADYLAAKRALDDRSLNGHVWSALVAAFDRFRDDPPAVVEFGAGIGTMIERLIERRALHRARYLAIERDPDLAKIARRRLAASTALVEAGKAIAIPTAGGSVVVDWRTADAIAWLNDPGPAGGWDLAIAHAFLDVVDQAGVVGRLARIVRPGGYLYASLTFDGLTAFDPPFDPALDDRIVALYHQTMDDRRVPAAVDPARLVPSGGSRAGRRLIGQVRAAGWEIVAAGASDWIVTPCAGGYPGDDARVLRFVIGTIEAALSGHPDLDPAALAAWLADRRTRAGRAELTFIAHQIDLLARRPPDGDPAPGRPADRGSRASRP